MNDGQLSLDGTLADYLPELEGRIEYADAITIRMLVQHRSGIPNYTATKDYWMDPPTEKADKLNLVLDQPADFKPDKRKRYCNTGYLLLGMIMDEVLGYPHYEFIQQEILDRLKLTNTFESKEEIDLDRLMSGYYVGIEHNIKTVDYGAMIATTEDVGRFLRSMHNGSLFGGDERAIYSSIYKFNHGGLMPGFQSMAKYHEDMDAVIVVVMNTTNFTGYHYNILQIMSRQIARIQKRSG